MRLSEHFTLRELARTDHRRLADENLNRANASIPALRALCQTLLEPVRAHYGVPLIIHSGFRCAALNRAVGGATASQHMQGEAADCHLVGVPLATAWRWIGTSGLPFGQLILEGYAGGEPSWIHLSLGPPWRAADRSGQVMAADVDPSTGRATYRLVAL